MGETRVDLLHLLEDLRDAYPGTLEETILTEIVANSLDSGARRVRLITSPVQSTLTVCDDGSGMKRRDLARYHDVAASTKTRGQGIGFAGVGIKLSLLLCHEVVTETRRGKSHVASEWRLSSRNRAPWRWIPPPGLVEARGTAVRLHVNNALSPLLDTGFLEQALRRHYQALLESGFETLLAEHYPHGVILEINGQPLVVAAPGAAEVARIEVRLPRRRKPSAVGYLVREPGALPEDRRGLAVSTLGKVIKRGWDWLGVTPATPERIGGLIEVPGLAESLTLNKADFIRAGARGALYLSYRKAVQEAVQRQLAAWGDARDMVEETHRRVARPVERDLERVLIDLADDFPLLAALVERREGGQRRLPIGKPGPDSLGALVPGMAGSATTPDAHSEAAGSPAPESSATLVAEPPAGFDAAPEDGKPAPPPAHAVLPGAGGPRRPARYGLGIQFDSRPDDPELGRLIESTVWVNEAHPAYRRAVASRSEGYHLALAVALALAPLAVEVEREHAFVTVFLQRWGSALDRRGRGR